MQYVDRRTGRVPSFAVASLALVLNLAGCADTVDPGSSESSGVEAAPASSVPPPPATTSFAESSPGSANIYSLSWDGRLWSSTVADPATLSDPDCNGSMAISPRPPKCLGGIALGAFVPDMVKLDTQGEPSFSNNQVLTTAMKLYLVSDEESDCHGHVSGAPIAIVPVPPLTVVDNPARVQCPTGTCEVYDVAVFSSRARPVTVPDGKSCDADCAPYSTCKTSTSTTECPCTSDTLVRGAWKVTVANPRTRSAIVTTVMPVTANSSGGVFEYLQDQSGNYIHGIEPTVTVDGNLLVYNDRAALKYLLWTPTATDSSAAHNWTRRADNGLASMATNEADPTTPTMVGALAFADRYPLARQPLLDAAGTPFPPGSDYPGAYAWLSPDASELFHTTMRGYQTEDASNPDPKDTSMRFGQAVIGQITNYQQRMIDTDANPNLFGQERQVVAPLGAYPSMWAPYADTPGLNFPVSPKRPLYVYFENRTRTYNELAFDDVKDGDYLVYLHMNQMTAQNPTWSGASMLLSFANLGITDDAHLGSTYVRTPDTSGYYSYPTWNVNKNTGSLKGGANFPADNRTSPKVNVGMTGQGILFPPGGYVSVDYNKQSFSRIAGQMSVQLWLKCLVKDDSNCAAKALVRLANAYTFSVNESGQLKALVWLGTSSNPLHPVTCTSTVAGLPSTPGASVDLLDGTFHSIGFSYHVNYNVGATAQPQPVLQLYIDGAHTDTCVDSSGYTGPYNVYGSSAGLVIGPQTTDSGAAASGQNIGNVLVLDEFAISSVARLDAEFATAGLRKPATPSHENTDTPSLPLWVAPGTLRIPVGGYEDDLVALGQKLFSDPALSLGNGTSCATCHNPSRAFADARGGPTSKGDNGGAGSRNAPSLQNRALATLQMRDGRATSLEAQALLPLTNADELGWAPQNGDSDRVTSTLIPKLTALDNSTRYPGLTKSGLTHALAVYERTLFAGDSQVDQYEAGASKAMSDDAVKGRILFHGKARCVSCHNGPNYTDELYHDTGFVTPSDVGRYDVTGRTHDKYAFRTPSLRNVGLTPPYLHDGSVATLSAMLDGYNMPSTGDHGLDPLIFPLGLSSQEKCYVVQFLKALSTTTPNMSSQSVCR